MLYIHFTSFENLSFDPVNNKVSNVEERTTAMLVPACMPLVCIFGDFCEVCPLRRFGFKSGRNLLKINVEGTVTDHFSKLL